MYVYVCMCMYRLYAKREGSLYTTNVLQVSRADRFPMDVFTSFYCSYLYIYIWRERDEGSVIMITLAIPITLAALCVCCI